MTSVQARLIGTHHVSVLFGVELPERAGGVHQITEHHGELAPFGVWGARGPQVEGVVWGRDTSCSHRLGGGWRRCGGMLAASPVHTSMRPSSSRASRWASIEFFLERRQLLIIQLELEPERAGTSHALGAGAWRSPGRGSPQRSSPTLPMPMRRAEDGVGIGKAIRAPLYRRWVTKESRKSWERVTQR